MEAFAIPDARDRLNTAVDALVDESIDGFSTHALGADVVDLRRAIERLEAECLSRLHRFDRAHGALADGGVNTISWVRDHCAMTGKAAADRVHLARTLGALPATLDSARAGRASLSNVTLIASLAKEVGVEQVAPLETILVSAAETLEAAPMRTVIQATRLRVDPDGVLAADNHAHERRWFNLDQSYGGEWFAQGQLDAEGGALVKTWLDAITEMPRPGDTRSASQRRADALVDLAALQLRCGKSPEVHGQRPHLTLTVSAKALRTGSEAEAAVLQGVGPIHPATARRIACDAVKTEVTVAPPSEGAVQTDVMGAPPAEGADAWLSTVTTPPVPLSVGRVTRTIPVHIRTALCLRDQGCRFPGCDRPISWTDGHHIIHWADGGPTVLENLVSLCRRHHREVHEQGWRIHMADGIPVVHPPP
jgi:Domain of unknown function (DUF222)/HNH endonuclease